MKKEDAFQIAQAHLNKKYVGGPEDGFVIIPDATIEKSYGWIFKFNSKLFLESGNIMYALGGNAPLVVDKHTGDVYELSSSTTSHEAIIAFEKKMGW